jgi:hypothetical protein
VLESGRVGEGVWTVIDDKGMVCRVGVPRC